MTVHKFKLRRAPGARCPQMRGDVVCRETHSTAADSWHSFVIFLFAAGGSENP